ncbi:MAG: hypothetical protein FJZ43_02310 [Candidatus Staskawiczbacteria bacterium]|nr:hypothetical protein [Candidatus Staskawiczbacteria bacterium]
MARYLKWIVISGILFCSHAIIFLSTESIKDLLSMNESIEEYDQVNLVEETSISSRRKKQIQVGVLIPEDLLFEEEQANLQLAQSFLSEKLNWKFIDKMRLPRVLGLKGIGFGFRVISDDRQIALE